MKNDLTWPVAHGPTKFKLPKKISGGPLGPNAVHPTFNNHWAKAGPVARLTPVISLLRGQIQRYAIDY